MPSVLITGASGFLGEHLAWRFERAGYTLYLTYSTQIPRSQAQGLYHIDLSKRGSLSSGLNDLASVDIVVHTAALADADRCEEDPLLARAINVEGTREVAQWAAYHGVRLIYVSTDLVYDGEKGMYTEDDVPRPINVYGSTKLQGEHIVRDLCASWAIIRLSLSYGPSKGKRGDWTRRMREDLAAGKDLYLFTDQYRTPVYVEDAAEAVLRLAETAATGIYHVGGSERVTRYEFGCTFARIFDLPMKKLHPIQMKDISAKAPRGRDCSLVTEKLSRELGICPCTVEQGLLRQKERESRGF